MERGECAFFVIRFYFRYDNESMWLSDLEVKDMPVPSSYNDISTEATLRDFVGWAWYYKTFYVSTSWAKKSVMLRFGSVHYSAQVWINGNVVGGHLGQDC